MLNNYTEQAPTNQNMTGYIIAGVAEVHAYSLSALHLIM